MVRFQSDKLSTAKIKVFRGEVYSKLNAEKMNYMDLKIVKIVFGRGASPPRTPYQGSALDLLGALSGPQTPCRN